MWIRNENSFFELEIGNEEELIDEIAKNSCIKVSRQITMQPTEKGLVFIQLSQMHPMFKACEQEYLNLGNISCFGVVDENSEEWIKIKQVALGESGIVKPKLSLVTD